MTASSRSRPRTLCGSKLCRTSQGTLPERIAQPRVKDWTWAGKGAARESKCAATDSGEWCPHLCCSRYRGNPSLGTSSPGEAEGKGEGGGRGLVRKSLASPTKHETVTRVPSTFYGSRPPLHIPSAPQRPLKAPNRRRHHTRHTCIPGRVTAAGLCSFPGPPPSLSSRCSSSCRTLSSHPPSLVLVSAPALWKEAGAPPLVAAGSPVIPPEVVSGPGPRLLARIALQQPRGRPRLSPPTRDACPRRKRMGLRGEEEGGNGGGG